MHIFQSWINSLALFKPSSLKLFLLVTLKSIVETYKLLFTKFWATILMFALVVCVSCLHIHMQDHVWYVNTPMLLLRALAVLFMIFFLYLLIRPSVLKKDIQYIKGYGSYFLMSLLFFCVIAVVLALIVGIAGAFIAGFAVNMSNIAFLNSWLTNGLLLLFVVYVSLVMPFYYFFFLDSDGRFYSAWRSAQRALKMVLYALPFIVTIYIFSHIVEYALQYAATILIVTMKVPQFIAIWGDCEIAYIQAIFTILMVLCMPLMGCFWNNFYVKNIHENFDLYFKRKEA